MGPGLLRPLPLFAIALTSLVVLTLSAYEVRSPTCAGNQTQPTWFGVVFWGLGPLSVLAVFCGVLAYGIREDWHPVGSVIAALGVTALWTGLGLYVVLGPFIGPCLS